ncbi:MAG: hypothetical protein LBP65_00925 [Puniceicoccales bacterium]|jgi:hypothetical protein|nr:hypothetical protein [Puniceicoccales bacterium]
MTCVEDFYRIFKCGWAGGKYPTTSAINAKRSVASEPSQIKVLSSTTTKCCGTATIIGRAVYTFGNVLFWICHIVTLGFVQRQVRSNTNAESDNDSLGSTPLSDDDFNNILKLPDEEFLNTVQLTDDTGNAIVVENLPPHERYPARNLQKNLRTQKVMKRLHEIAEKNSDLVYQRLMRTDPYPILHCAVQSDDYTVQQCIFELLEILGEQNMDHAFALLAVKNEFDLNLMNMALLHTDTDTQQQYLVWLRDALLKEESQEDNPEVRAKIVHGLLFDPATRTAIELCTLIIRARRVAKVMEGLLNLLRAFPLKNAVCIGLLLDLLELKPSNSADVYVSTLHCIFAPECAQNDSTLMDFSGNRKYFAKSLINDIRGSIKLIRSQNDNIVNRMNALMLLKDEKNRTIDDLLSDRPIKVSKKK